MSINMSRFCEFLSNILINDNNFVLGPSNAA